ncbi:MAG: cupin domain-containing protein [Cyclobacteriaceae bacterium]
MMKIIISFTLSLMMFSATAQLKPVQSGVYQWSNLPVKKSEGRESRKILEGTSAHLDYLEIHATTQYPGAKPSQMHANEDIEELILVKEGTLKVMYGDRESIMGPESAFLLMPRQMHSLSNAGKDNLTYFVVRFKAKNPMKLARGLENGGTAAFNSDSLEFETKVDGSGGARAYFDRPSAMFERLEMHVTQLGSGSTSHKGHSHIETEIVLMISGESEMKIDGKKYYGNTGDLYFMESQLEHGILNISDLPCTYYAFKWK